MTDYKTLRKLDVSAHIEKKGKLSYLSWVWAVDQLLQADPKAEWHHPPAQYFGETLMVFCTVTAFGKSMTAQLPVMNHQNKAIANPDAFAVNTAMQRCLAKAIALHGIGLYIYAGEDLRNGNPANDPDQPETKPATLTAEQITSIYDLAKEVQFDPKLILKAYKAKRFEEVLASRYQSIINNLESKRHAPH